MLFDLACRVAERQVPELERVLRRVALFLLPAAPHTFLPKSWEEDEAEFYQENFFLPFPMIAIEDTASLTLLMDIEEGAVGSDKPRNFIEVMDMHMTNLDAFREHGSAEEAEALQLMSQMPKESLCIAFGNLCVLIKPGGKVLTAGTVERVVVATPDKVICDVLGDFRELGGHDAVDKPALRNATTAWQEVMYLNNPERFVVQVVNTGAAKKASGSQKIKRAHQRPHYILMSVGELRKTLGVYDHTDRHQSSHWRKRHFRRLVADRFVNKKGQVVIVKQAWIGPEEATVGKKHYKVLLDR